SISPTTGNVSPGQSMTYTIVVSNTGPGFINGVLVTDPFPSNFNVTGWTAASTGTNPATGFTASGTGDIDDPAVDLPANSQVTYTVKGTFVLGEENLQLGLSNTA